MSADEEEPGGNWTGPERWQVILAVLSLIVAIIALVG